MTAEEIANAVGGTLVGAAEVWVERVAPLDRATARELSFLGSAKYAALFERSGAGVVLVTPELAEAPGVCGARVIVPRPHDALLTLLPRFYRPADREGGVDPTAVVAPSARLGEGVRVEPYAVIGADAVIGDRAWIGAHTVVEPGVVIGEDTRLFPHITLYSGTVLGARVIIHSGSRIGSDGFGYVFRDGAHQKIPHVGHCIISNDVEIGANVTVDRGSIDDTVIGEGTKLDNLVHVGHNVRIGRLCLLMAQVGIAGSARIEDGVILAGQSGVGGHITLGAQARVAAKAGVIRDMPAGETWSGFPARPHRDVMRASATLFKLSGLLKRIERLIEKDDGT